jgi:MoxR-like ATPase
MSGEEIIYFQGLVRRVPVTDNVMEYAVRLVHKTRPNEQGSDIARNYISWGAGPRASQNLIMGAKCYALLHGKFSPDIEDVKAVALPILRHRLVRNYKAEAEGLKIEDIIAKLL